MQGTWLNRIIDGLRLGLDRNANAVLALRLNYVALEFLSSLALARLFKASAYGTYAFVLAVVGVLAVPACAGFDRLLIREVATLQAQRRWELLRGLLRRASQIVLLTSVSIALAGAATIWFLSGTLEAGMITALAVGVALVPIIALARLRVAALQGLGRVALGQMPEMLLQPVALLILATIAYLATDTARSGADVVALHLGAALLAMAAGVLLWRRHRPEPMSAGTPSYRTREWLATSIPFIAILGFGVALTSLDTIFVGSQFGPVSAGVYRIASQMAMLVGFPLTAVNMVAAPRIASLRAEGDHAEMQRVASRSSRQVLALAIPACIALLILGEPVLRLFGPEFSSGYPSLVILSCAYVATSAMGIGGYLLIMTGHERPTAIAFAVMAFANAIGNFFLIPRFGLEGAATATAICMIGLAIWLAALSRSLLKIDTIDFRRRQSLDNAE